MIRLSRLTDYGLLLLTQFARKDAGPMKSARDLAEVAHLPLPTVSKILKVLARNGLDEIRRVVRVQQPDPQHLLGRRKAADQRRLLQQHRPRHVRRVEMLPCGNRVADHDDHAGIRS